MQRVTSSILSRYKDDWQFFLPFDILWLGVGPCLGSSVPAWFRVDSGMNLIKQMEIVTGGFLSQWSEFSHGTREVLGSNHRSDHILFPDLWHLMAQCGSKFGQRAAKTNCPQPLLM